MKRLLFASLLFIVTGCGSSQQTVHSAPPRDFGESMDRITADIAQVDKHLIGAQYDLAEQECVRICDYTANLGSFDPLHMGDQTDDYMEYQAQCQDMHRSADRLLYLTQQRRKEQAKDELAILAARYNRMSRTYGPGNEISLFERPAEKLRGLETYRSDQPGEYSASK
ncbi:hypothetical protein PLCT1_01640 [Planctomycetaceae bacterium]|nr:hypothetical protein PLCT1_01640 [Planctomycetaceae bacterium]